MQARKQVVNTNLIDVIIMMLKSQKNGKHYKTMSKLSLTYPYAHSLVRGWAMCPRAPWLTWEHDQFALR